MQCNAVNACINWKFKRALNWNPEKNLQSNNFSVISSTDRKNGKIHVMNALAYCCKSLGKP